MNILYLIHQFYPESSGGTERFLLNLAHGLQRRGHHAEVVAYSFEDSLLFQKAGTVLKRHYVYDRLPVTAFRHVKPSIEVNSYVANSEIALLAKNVLSTAKYDLVHIVHPMRVMPFATVAAELGIPYIVTLTDFWTICPKITLQTSYGNLCAGPNDGQSCAELCPELPSAWVEARLAAIHAILQCARALAAPSAFAAALVRKQFPDLAITVVPHGLRRNRFSKKSSQYVPGSSIVFGYCGGLAPHKGVHLLVKAFRALKSDKASLLIFGAAGPNDKNYERELHRAAAGDARIQFRGPYKADQIGRALQSLDVLVVPSLWYETYSFSLHEAQSCGVPVIASKVGVLAEKLREGEAGLTFPLKDEEALARQLGLLAENPTLLNAMRHNLESFDPPWEEEEAYAYERIYGKACHPETQ